MRSPQTPDRRPKSLSEAKETLQKILSQHHQNLGIGPDAYHPNPIVHPMAEGRFLSASAALTRTKLMSPQLFRIYAEASIDRLAERKRAFAAGAGWGLEFAYKEAGANAPYLITTAIVAHGLMDLVSELPELKAAQILLDEALEGLSSWSDQSSIYNPDLNIELPAYSEKLKSPVLNAAAYAAGVLCAAGRDPFGIEKHRLEKIKAALVPGSGWTYMPEVPIIDLIHQSYILSALDLGLTGDPAYASFHAQTLTEIIALFTSTPGNLFDTGRLVYAPLVEPPPPNHVARVNGDHHILLRTDTARLWSLGDLLAVLSAVISSRTPQTTSKWRAFSGPICDSILLNFDMPQGEALYPRHRMHAAYGIARYIEGIRAAVTKTGATVE